MASISCLKYIIKHDRGDLDHEGTSLFVCNPVLVVAHGGQQGRGSGGSMAA